ncbi:hypothetical protein [Erwinia pyrifoliae]|uniref:hypothetical protein n=1 Tax=Erwinia pyrifoliae TaxID=79967 RepID=UPI00019615AB|nr:hypothetical protein [Erwinia pyrifoliae]AUX71102.1 hypothetical protein CPI84_00285 [Erwinia pyrifoliae]MCA8875187.1 hypothetical protein [Erwinia pyrifoliae]CAX57395.1 uncharacterized protein EpC_36150 [Erwinia pyrifoliae Ep1/96]CAY76271.1 hypothetical protein EPYR_03891 [Erwinia pyrifoliae DSM 12163]
MNKAKTFFSFISILAALVSLPAYAAQSEYYCSGSYGDNNDSGLWDLTFTASSEKDAARQAKEKYILNMPGAWVKVFQCHALK